MLFRIILLFIIFLPLHCFSQETSLSENIINIAEELATDESDPDAAMVYFERLYELTENPVKLNSANEEEISRLFFLSDFQVKALTDYVQSSGQIVSIHEVSNIPGFDKETVEMLTIFITLNTEIKSRTVPARFRNSLLTNISNKSGNYDSTTIGSSWKILTKYKFTSGEISGGFTTEKDPGEPFINNYQHLPDFISSHIAFNGRGFVRKLIIGDFSARYGQGTVINTGMRTSLSTTSQGYMSARDEIKPYTSTDENNFFRGLATELSLKNFGLILFYSQNSTDATIDYSTDYSENHIKSFYRSGIHNTNSLLQKKDVVSERVITTNLSLNLNNIKIGIAWSGTRLSLPVIPEPDDPQNIFSFRGSKNNLYTIYYNALIKRILIYGEMSATETGKYAFVQGISLRPSDRLTLNFLYRNYNAGYISFHGKGPGNNSVTGNEQGILGNFSFEIARHLFLVAGCDIYNFPWLKYLNSSPSNGMKQEIRLKYLPTEKLTVEASYNLKVSTHDLSEDPGIPEQIHITSNSYKISARYSPSEKIRLITRIDYKRAGPSGSTGMLMLQDLTYSLTRIPVTLWFRYCIFNTDDWNSRIYTYENDLLYSFSIPSVFGQGSRSYLMVKWKLYDYAEMRVKYGLTSMVNNLSSQDNREEFKLQFRIRF